MRPETAQDQQNEILEQPLPKDFKGDKQLLQSLLAEKEKISSEQVPSTAYDPIASAMRDNPNLTREAAEKFMDDMGY